MKPHRLTATELGDAFITAALYECQRRQRPGLEEREIKRWVWTILEKIRPARRQELAYARAFLTREGWGLGVGKAKEQERDGEGEESDEEEMRGGMGGRSIDVER